MPEQYYRDVLPDGVNSLTAGGLSGGEITEIKVITYYLS